MQIKLYYPAGWMLFEFILRSVIPMCKPSPRPSTTPPSSSSSRFEHSRIIKPLSWCH